MLAPLKRYALDYHGSHGEDAYMAEDPDGEWCKVEDVKKILAALELEEATTNDLAKEVAELSANRGMTERQAEIVIKLIEAKLAEWKAEHSEHGNGMEYLACMRLEEELKASVKERDE